MVQNDLFNPLYFKEIARKLAMINCMDDFPINKKSNWLISNLNYLNSFIKREIQIENVDDEHKEIAKQLLAVDYESEIKWIAKHVISKVESPIVFCNNHVISPNILMRNKILDQIDNQNHEKLIDN